MLSGKPARPWKRKRRGVSVARIALLVLLLGAAAAYGLWRMRPTPVAWQPVGAERIVTPALDFASEGTRAPLRLLSRAGLNHYRGEWLGWVCSADGSMPGEIYLLTDSGDGYRPGVEVVPVRITAALDAGGGEIIREELVRATNDVARRQRRSLDHEASERFRSLLTEGGFASLPPAGPHCSDTPLLTLESCIGGRYFGAYGSCGVHGDEVSLVRLAEAIDQFARDGAVPVPVPPLRLPPSNQAPGLDEEDRTE